MVAGVAGAVWLVAIVVPVVWGSAHLVRRLLPAWSGPPCVLAAVIAMVATWIGVGQLLAAVGLFNLPAVAAGCLLMGLAMGLAGRRRVPCAREQRARLTGWGRFEFALVAGVVVLVVGTWVARSLTSWHSGVLEYDSLFYHLDHAARFVHDRSLWHQDLTTYDPFTSFWPANGELVQAVFMLPFHGDLLLPFLNVGWLGLALLGGWCLGREPRSAALCMLGVAVVVDMPYLVKAAAGTAQVDVAVLALVVAGTALLLRGGWSRSTLTLSGLALGMALGTKVTVLVFVAVLTVGIVVVGPTGRRLARGLVWAAGISVLSAVWFVRNLVLVGNPIPALRLHLGSVRLPSPPMPNVDRFGHTIAGFATHPGFWRTVASEMHNYFGLLWPVWAVGVISGLLIAALMPAGSRLLRIVGLAGIAGGVAYLFTPFTVFPVPLHGVAVRFGIRAHAFLAALGLGLLPSLRLLSGSRARAALLMGGLAVLGGFEVLNERLLGASSFAFALGAAAVTAALVLVGTRVALQPLVAGVATIALVALVVGRPAYLRHRYATTWPDEGSQYLAVFRWAGAVHHERIGYARFAFPYPLYGPDLSNAAIDIGRHGPDRAFGPVASCSEWRHALVTARVDYAVLGPYDELGENTPPPRPPTPESGWTRSIPGATEILHVQDLSVFDLRTANLRERC